MRPKPLILAGFLIALPACAAVAGGNREATPAPVELKAADGAVIGRVELIPARSGVLIRLQARDLPPGWHGMHLHAVGRCDDSGFQAAGGHINHPDHTRPHGLLNPEGPDFGDLPNLHVAADGTASLEAFSTLVSRGGSGDRPALDDADGSALVIHENADDHRTQPIGGAGARIACAVLAPPRD